MSFGEDICVQICVQVPRRRLEDVPLWGQQTRTPPAKAARVGLHGATAGAP